MENLKTFKTFSEGKEDYQTEYKNKKFAELKDKFKITFKYGRGKEFGDGRFVITDLSIDDLGNYGYEIFDRMAHNVFNIPEKDIQTLNRK